MKNTIVRICLLLALLSCKNETTNIPAFNLKKIDGSSVSLADMKGKITVVNVWATWCGTCVEEIDELNKLADKYNADTTIQFWALADEESEKVERFLQKKDFKFSHIPSASVLTDAFQTRFVKTYPQHIIIGKDLKVKFEGSNGLENASELLSKKIEKNR
jgi:peroxiredoxin